MKRSTVNYPLFGSISFPARGPRQPRASAPKRAFASVLLAAFCTLLALLPARSPAQSLTELWRERSASVVAVEFRIAGTGGVASSGEVQAFGTVIDESGTVIFSTGAIDQQMPLDALRDFRIYLPGGDTDAPIPARYLGYDAFTDWHFVQVESPGAAALLTPITRFRALSFYDGQSSRPQVAEELWGIGLRKKDEGFAPYFLSSRVSLVAEVPEAFAFAAREVAGPGLPVFNGAGDFVGLGQGGFGQAALQFSERDRDGIPVVMINPDETSAVLLAEEVLPHLRTRIPASASARTAAWAGFERLRPVDRETAERLGLGKRPALTVGDVLPDSPAQKAGMQPGDVVVSINSRELPAIRPPSRLGRYLEREVARRAPGDTLFIEVVRERADEPRILILTLENAPY